METKYLNPLIAEKLQAVLRRNDIRIELKRQPGVDTWYVIDPENKVLFSYVNGYDYGLYSIDVNGQTAANIQWFESYNKTTPEQNAVFEIHRLICKKEKELKALATMSEADKTIMNILSQYTRENIKK